METMTAEHENEEPVSVDEYNQIKGDYDKVINSVEKVQELIQANDMDDALDTLSNIETDCSICQGEIDEAKQKIQTVHEICNIEKTTSDKRCQVMSNFILDNLSEFVSNINLALKELKSEAYGESED